MRRHRHVTLGGNRCAAAEAPVLPHKARIFGMSNEQVLCIIHLCSIFHAEEQESGFFGVCWGGLSEKKKKKKKKCCQPSSSVWCTSQQDPPIFRSEYVFVYSLREYMHVSAMSH